MVGGAIREQPTLFLVTVPLTQNAQHAAGDGQTCVGDIAQRLCGEAIGANGFDADAVAAIVDEAKQRGLIDQALTTSSIVFFCQAFGLGAHTLESARLNDGGGGVETWRAVMEHMLEALGPDRPATPQPTA